MTNTELANCIIQNVYKQNQSLDKLFKDNCDLGSLFTWSYTPENYSFWCEQYFYFRNNNINIKQFCLQYATCVFNLPFVNLTFLI